MSSLKKLSDPDTDPTEVDAIIGAFVRQHENERLRKRWTNLLRQEGEKKAAAPPGTTKVRPLKAKRRWWLVAAAILLVSLLTVPLLWPSAASGADLLAEDRAAITLITYRSAVGLDTSPDSLRRVAIALFAGGDLQAAARVGERLLASTAATAKDSLNLGLIYSKDGAYQEVVRLLQPMAEAAAGTYRTEARYWLAAAWLGQGRIAEGKELLTTIRPEDGQRFYRKAQALLRASW
ncbi:MAG: hypothetical protein AAFZ52_03125 [Bacteroidota bacterium]